MICEECKKEGKKSQVNEGPSMTTCMGFSPYYDEDGKHHSHDPNTSTVSFSCSNGHSWVERIGGSCWCGWSRD